jgi:hypothetical protein
MKKFIAPSILFIMATVMCSCVAYTKLTGTWTKPGYTGTHFKKILVVAISNDPTKRNSVETSLESTLAFNKITATNSAKMIDFSKVDKNKDGKVDSTKRDAVLKMLTDAGYDGALVVSLLDIKEETQYVPGQTYYHPSYYSVYGSGYYGGFYGYSYSTYDVVNTPGYLVETKKIYIETRLFDLTKDELLWGSKTVTEDPSDINDFSESLATAIVKAALKDGAFK